MGDSEAVRCFAADPGAVRAFETHGANGRESNVPEFVAESGFWSAPLYGPENEQPLGVLVVKARTPDVALDVAEQQEATQLLNQAAAALADRYVQEGVFATLQQILPDLERIQEWRGAVRYAQPLLSPRIDGGEPVDAGSWQQWVKDALSHYWGGPKLSDSPLSALHVVARALQTQDGNPTRALRSVLQEAIERQRPPGERRFPASEWLLYNILDLRFVQGQRVREIANRLAMSESDLYRKQRAAVAEVARTLAEMEAEAIAEESTGRKENHG